MGELEPNDSRNVTGTAVTPDGRWTGQAANDPSRQDQQQAQQGGQDSPQSAPQQNMGGSQGEIGQENDGVSDTSNQGNDHTSGIGQDQDAGAAGSGQASYGNSGQGSGQDSGFGQAQQFQDNTGQQGGGGQQGGSQFADQLQKHQEVVDSSGQHVGTIDHVDGDRIKLTRKDSPDGEHHYISLSDVESVEGDQVRLSGASGSGTQA
jgi:hypothetical protein